MRQCFGITSRHIKNLFTKSVPSPKHRSCADISEVMTLFSDRGTPKSYRHMNGYSGHTFKFTRVDGRYTYVQIHVKTDQGIETLTNDEAARRAMTDPDGHTRDLFNAIKGGDYPTWTVFIQVMNPKDLENSKINIFDLTKVWPQKDFPLRPVGKIILNRNVRLWSPPYI